MKLDKSKPYGVISGDHYGAMFEQDGRLFGADDQEIVVADEVVALDTKQIPTDEDEDRDNAVAVAPLINIPKLAQTKKNAPGRKKQPAAVVAEPSPVDEQIAAQAGV